MTTITVTGATGHLGTNLVRRLVADGHAVRVLTAEPDDREVPALAGLPVDRIHGDVTNGASLRDAFRGADLVFHVAGRVSIARRDGAVLWHVNHLGAQIVAETARRTGVGRLVHVSSVQTLASRDHLDEHGPRVDLTAPAYDQSKLAGERAVLDAAARGLDAVIVLPTGIIGPHDQGFSQTGRSLDRIWRGRMPAVTTGGHDWVDVRDVVEGMIAAARKAPTGRRYLLGGSWASIADLSRRAAALVGRHGPATLPMGLARAVAPAAEAAATVAGREPTFTGIALRALRHHRFVDHGRASRELGYRPRPLDQTLADTHASWRDRSTRTELALPQPAGVGS